MREYLEYEVSYEKKYKKYYLNYKNAMIIFDIILREEERESDLLSKINYNRLKQKAGCTFSAVYNIKSVIYLFLNAVKRREAHPANIVVLLGDRFKLLNESISNVAKRNNLGVFNTLAINHIRKVNKLRGNINNKLLGINSLLYPKELRLILRDYKYNELHKLLDNPNIMKKIDDIVKTKINDVCQTFINNKVSIIFMAEDQSYENRLICEAAKLANIPSFVFLHGYPTNKYIGVLPVNSERLLVWDHEQESTFRKIAEGSKYSIKEKVELFGYPKFDLRFIEKKKRIINEQQNVVLFVSQPLEEVGYSSFNRNELYLKLKELMDLGYRVRVRLHPKEKKNQIKLEQINNFGFEISDSDLLEDILQSSFVLGYNSSVLYEAELIKGNALQVENNFLKSNYSQIKSIKLHEITNIENVYKSRKEHSISENLIDNFEEKLVKFLERAKTY